MLRALAAILLVGTMPAAAAEPFTGPHVEAIAGYDRTDVGPGLGAAGGLLYGIGAGYDVALDRIRVGGEVEANDSTAAQAVTGVERRVGRSLYAGVRAGVVVASRLLVYAKGGYANGRFGDSFTGDGLRIGGGGEFALTGQAFLRAEYRFSDYGQEARGQTWVAGLGLRF